jgi:ATP adenylyltransferase
MTFIQGPPRKTCFFCEYAKSPGRDRDNLVLLRGRDCFVLMNRFPYNNGHLMVAPLSHAGDLGKLKPGARREMFDLLVAAQKGLDRALRPDGYNIGINLGRVAGAGVPGHVHVHVVPRWNGDTNFMPVLGLTKVIPEALRSLHGRLQKALSNGR